ncbi:hypothetical protein JQX14_24370 [Sulfitobacter pseudonitzschiae]|uniref:Uncharacterized protein n=1 Tax=Pseudosulfitobacter pseudonitzschiae TaxID=1402135 RepID=A0A9Q2RZS0_9RHOB|nr:hypothetical protein [Pseudosulfitobacter pseudonitzschiae]
MRLDLREKAFSGIVTLTRLVCNLYKVRTSSDVCRIFPCLECFEPMVADCEGSAAAGWDREGITCCGMDGDEALQSTRRSETLHVNRHANLARKHPPKAVAVPY